MNADQPCSNTEPHPAHTWIALTHDAALPLSRENCPGVAEEDA